MDKDEITRLRSGGLTYKQISEVIGKSIQSVYQFCSKNGITDIKVRHSSARRIEKNHAKIDGRKKTLSQYRADFCNQRSNAARRGIEWCLTFEEWYEWWGDDIDKRGSGHGSLQMQRTADSGPYALWNIRKGYPRDNSHTWAIVAANRRQKRIAKERENFKNALMYAASDLDRDNTDWSSTDIAAPQNNGRVRKGLSHTLSDIS